MKLSRMQNANSNDWKKETDFLTIPYVGHDQPQKLTIRHAHSSYLDFQTKHWNNGIS
jgi:hypothetical protein